MLDDLTGTLAELRQRIQQHGDTISPFEARTHATLIDPLLRTLGWDVADPGKVRIECEVDETRRRVDYALLGDRGQPILFVEAKKLATKKHALEQTAAYVIAQNDRHNTNIRYCVWTNGDTWLAWDIANQARGRMMDVWISEGRDAKNALKMVGLWRASLLDGTFMHPTVMDPHSDHRDIPRATPPTTTKTVPAGRLADTARTALLADIEAGGHTQAALAIRYGISRGAVAYYVRKLKQG